MSIKKLSEAIREINIVIEATLQPFIRLIEILLAPLFLFDRKGIYRNDFNQPNKETRERLDRLEALSSQEIIGNNSDKIQESVDKSLKENINSIVIKTVSDPEKFKDTIVSEVRNEARNTVKDYLESKPQEELINHFLQYKKQILKEEKNRKYREDIEQQLRSGYSLRMVMINLFVIFNLALIASYFFKGTMIEPNILYGIIGLYISLSFFIVYIYRANNARMLVLMALLEDIKKTEEAFDYLQQHCSNREPNESDNDIIRTFLTNHSERENTPGHPYELILKGIENSTILLKGGKVSQKEK